MTVIAPGTLFGDRYLILSILARGGMGTTFRVWDMQRQMPAVLKTPVAKATGGAEADVLHRRFAAETAAMQQLQHPFMVPLLDHGACHGLPYLILRYFPGGSLKDQFTHGGRSQPMSSFDTLYSWVPRVAEALDYMHSKGVVHRDVKPQNIFFSAFRKGYLGDFGIAKHVVPQAKVTAITRTHFAVGTLEYLAPECLEDDATTTGLSDQFSLAVSVFEALTGRKPFQGNLSQVVAAHLQPAPSLPSFTDLPSGASSVVQKALSRIPESRFATCADFCQALLSCSAPARPDLTVATVLCPKCGQLFPAPRASTPHRHACPSCEALIEISGDGTNVLLQEDVKLIESFNETPYLTVPIQRLGRGKQKKRPAGNLLLSRLSLRGLCRGGVATLLILGVLSASFLMVRVLRKDLAPPNVDLGSSSDIVPTIPRTISVAPGIPNSPAQHENSTTSKRFATVLRPATRVLERVGEGSFRVADKYCVDVGWRLYSPKQEQSLEWIVVKNDAETSTITLESGADTRRRDANVLTGRLVGVTGVVGMPVPTRHIFLRGNNPARVGDHVETERGSTTAKVVGVVGLAIELSRAVYVEPGDVLTFNPVASFIGSSVNAIAVEGLLPESFQGPSGLTFNLIVPSGDVRPYERDADIVGVPQSVARPFYLSTTEVTASQMRRNSLSGDSLQGAEDPEHPASGVRFRLAARYCELLSEASGSDGESFGFRLPTEAEWEFACRPNGLAGGSQKSSQDTLDRFAWYSANSGGRLHRVAQKEPNSWGLFDMQGNVSEWCLDVFRDKPNPLYLDYLYTVDSDGRVSPSVSGVEASGWPRVLKGGDCVSSEVRCASIARKGQPENAGLEYVGFRVALTPRPEYRVPAQLTNAGVKALQTFVSENPDGMLDLSDQEAVFRKRSDRFPL